MANDYSFEPRWGSPPGDTIKECLEQSGMSVQTLAGHLGLEVVHAEDLLHGFRAIDEALADKLQVVLGGPAHFWMNRERQFREAHARFLHESIREDDPLYDGTDAAHPAWWRGQADGVAGVVRRLNQILDGQDEGVGVMGDNDLEALRRRILALPRPAPWIPAGSFRADLLGAYEPRSVNRWVKAWGFDLDPLFAAKVSVAETATHRIEIDYDERGLYTAIRVFRRMATLHAG